MKGATVRPATVPALVLCAALMTSAAPLRAGGEPVVPFPGTSVPGTSVPGALEDVGGKSAEAAPPPASGAAAAGPAAGHETVAPPDAGAEMAEVAAPATGAGPSDAAVPDGDLAAEKPAAPAGGSRLLRALAERPQTLVPETLVPGTLGSGETARPEAVRVFAAEGCPRALLRRLLAGAAGEADALSALGIEREILILCRERQEIVAGLFETEARLRELREVGRGPETGMPAAGAAPAPRVEAAGGAPAVARAAASPLRAALGDAAEKANEADAPAGDLQGGEPRGTELQTSRYAWFSIIGVAGALRAGISDGTGVWFVREGDPLPGGATVAAIAGRPPGVQVTGAGESGEATLLPFRARPGGGP